MVSHLGPLPLLIQMVGGQIVKAVDIVDAVVAWYM